MRDRLCLVLLATLCGAGAAAAAPGSQQARQFVQAAGQSDTFEQLEADTVLTGSRDPAVRAYAQRMLADHGQTSQALARAAARAGLEPPPAALGEDQAHLLAALQGVAGVDFDRTYARQQVLAHRSALTVEQVYARSGDDPGLRAAASAAVPVISAHLAAAETLRARLGGS